MHADEIGSRGRERGDGGGADAALIVGGRSLKRGKGRNRERRARGRETLCSNASLRVMIIALRLRLYNRPRYSEKRLRRASSYPSEYPPELLPRNRNNQRGSVVGTRRAGLMINEDRDEIIVASDSSRFRRSFESEELRNKSQSWH